MTEQGGRSQAGLEAELRARGFEPTDIYTATGRFWRKQGGRPPRPHLHVPHAVDGFYPESLLQELQQRIRLINDWMRPRLIAEE